ncbi:MAG: RnfABCDGE type electron transport complex subunit D [Methyloprofundus sp.]|nr:RnfABCDGE type electron transport complex subunit D [Methyloprofundus sp.]
MQFPISSSPFTPRNNSISRVMLHVLYALLPVTAIHSYLFGYGLLIQLLLAVSTALVTESLCLLLRKRAIKPALYDLSAVLSAVLLALAIPSIAPWWVIVSGMVFAIGIGKQVYGGLGYNPFNPAMVGYVFLLISFPLQMSLWQESSNALSLSDSLAIIFANGSVLDGISGATLLDGVKTQLSTGLSLIDIKMLPVDERLNLIPFAYCVGGLWLLHKKIIQWQIPTALILGLCLPATLAYLIDSRQFSSPIFHLVSGATFCAAFFIATDPVTAATSNKGRWIYAGLIGCLIYIIRTWGGYPEGVAFAVLLANLAAPSIDIYTRSKIR